MSRTDAITTAGAAPAHSPVHVAGIDALRALAVLAVITYHLNPDLLVSTILLTMYDGRTLHSREVVQSVVEHFGETVFHTVISRTVKFPDATAAGLPITGFAPSSAAAEAYRTVARELVSRGCAP